MKEGEVRQMLGRFGLTGITQLQQIATLSGGKYNNSALSLNASLILCLNYVPYLCVSQVKRVVSFSLKFV